MSNPCDRIQKKLVKLHLTRLPITDDPEVQAHLASCPACRLYLEHLDHDHRELEDYAESLDSYVDNVKEKLHQHIEQEHPQQVKPTPFPWWAVAATIPLVIALVFFFRQNRSESQSSVGPKITQQEQVSPNNLIPNPAAQAIAMEHTLAQQHLEQGNVPALVELLDSEYEKTRVRAAHYLAQVGDASVLPRLEKLARRWNHPTEMNPYAQAIVQIGQRLAETMEAPPGPNVPVQVASPLGGRDLTPSAEGVQLEVRVREKTGGQPLSEVKVFMPARDRNEQEGLTNAQGICRVGYTEKDIPGLGFRVVKAGYVGMAVELANLTRETSPHRVDFALEPALRMGGMVQDPNGKPVAGAKIYFNYEQREVKTGPYVLVDFETYTDSEGRWNCDYLPEHMDRLDIHASHADFVLTTVTVSNFSDPLTNTIGLETLHQETFALVLDRGRSIPGTVVDIQGSPIPNARLETTQLKGIRTDAQGDFVLGPIATADAWVDIVVSAEGYPPVEKRLSIENGPSARQIVLRPGVNQSGRVVAWDGLPLADVRVTTNVAWRIYRPEWEVVTDANGFFELQNLPKQRLSVRFHKPEFMSTSLSLVPGRPLQDVTLQPVLRVTGSVVDAETGLPIEAFKVIQGSYYKRQDKIHWELDPSTIEVQGHGRLSHQFDQAHDGYALLIEAEGYVPRESRLLLPGEQQAELNFPLMKGRGLEGEVFGSDGQPVPGVDVFASYKDHVVILREGVPSGEKLFLGRTDVNGRFTLNQRPGMQHVVAVSPQGMGSVPMSAFSKSHVIVLEPWASVEGDLYIGSQPAQGYRLNAIQPDDVAEMYGYWGDSVCTTDERGHFFFPKIPPGRLILYQREYRVEPGQHLLLQLGGDGRTIKGRFHLASEDADLSPAWRFDVVDLAESDDKDAAGAWYSFRVNEEGAFRFDNLKPGHYALCGAFTPDWTQHSLVQAGRLWHEFVVPPITEEPQLDEPINLGTIELLPGDLEIGMTAPSFDLMRIRGGQAGLADYTGKLCLLVFYRMEEFEASDERLRSLEKACGPFLQDERFAMLGVLSGFEVSPPDVAVVTASDLPWPQAWAGKTGQNRMHMEYDVINTHWPWTILIDPDGTVLAIGLQGEELMEAIETHLP